MNCFKDFEKKMQFLELSISEFEPIREREVSTYTSTTLSHMWSRTITLYNEQEVNNYLPPEDRVDFLMSLHAHEKGYVSVLKGKNHKLMVLFEEGIYCGSVWIYIEDSLHVYGMKISFESYFNRKLEGFGIMLDYLEEIANYHNRSILILSPFNLSKEALKTRDYVQIDGVFRKDSLTEREKQSDFID